MTLDFYLIFIIYATLLIQIVIITLRLKIGVILLKEQLLEWGKRLNTECADIMLYPECHNEPVFRHFKGVVPNEYKDFLSLYNGVKNCTEGVSIIGTENFDEIITKIEEIMSEAAYLAEQVYNVNTNDLEEIRQWEIRTVQYYLPHYFIFGVVNQSDVLFFNKYNKSEEGYCEIIVWNNTDGVIKNYQNLILFLNDFLKK